MDAEAASRAGYNQIVSRSLPSCLICVLVLTACGNDLKTKEKVQAAVFDRLNHSGLDLKSMDVATTNVSFDGNLAYATVTFHPKDDPTVNGGMSMKYTLEGRDGKWVVTKVGDSTGHSMASPASGDSSLPPGHPSISPLSNQGASPDTPHTPAQSQ
jgi:hypothetical protein